VRFSHLGETGTMEIVPVFDGVLLCLNDFHMHQVPNDSHAQTRQLLVNYCEEGRCEVNLGDHGFVYVDTGWLSVDAHAATDLFVYPTGRYKGVEYLFDLDELARFTPQAFVELGIDPSALPGIFCPDGKGFLARAPEHVESIFQSISSARAEPLPFYRLKTLELLYALVNMDRGTVRSRRTWLTNGQTMIAKQVYADMTESPQRPIDVPGLAQRFGVSASSVRSYFRSVYGENLSVVLRRARMEKAARLLRESDLLVTEVALESGYENQSKFAAAFRRFTGDAPLEYRRKTRCAGAEGAERAMPRT
jgi:AraC-like DNA-binding protein